MQEPNTPWRKRIQRPLGVYIISIYDFVVVGVIPLLTFVLALRNSDAEISFFLIVLSVGMYVVVMAAAVLACTGENLGRWLLLSSVTFAAVSWIVNASLTLSQMANETYGRPRVIGFISRGIVALAVNWWYLNRRSTIAYYKQPPRVN
jgi:hypothetical protein